MVASKWYALEKYLTKLEEYLQDALGELDAKVSELLKQSKNLPPEGSENLVDLAGEYNYDREEFPRILRNSFLVSAISLLEYEMDMICRRLKEEQQIPITLSDLHGNLLKRVKLYLKLAGLDLLYEDKIWKEITNYLKVRNCIVHNRGLLQGDEEEKALIPYIKRKKILSENDEREIALTAHFCKEVIQTIRKFTDKVWTKIYELPVRPKAR